MQNCSVHFYLQKKKVSGTDGSYRVLMSVHFDGKRLIYYTGYSVWDYQWEKRKQGFTGRNDAEILNMQLEALKNKTVEIYRLLSKREPGFSLHDFRSEIKKLGKSRVLEISTAFIRFLEMNHEQWNVLTYRKFKSLYRYLSRFLDENPGSWALESAGSHFLGEMENFLEKQGMAGLTISVYLDMLKGFLNFSLRESWMFNTDFRNFRKRNKSLAKQNKSIAYLDSSMLNRMISATLSSRKAEHVRDIFCLVCLTGITFPELTQLTRTDYNGKSLKAGRKGKREIHLNLPARTIIESYNNRFFRNNRLLPEYSPVTANRILQEVFWEAGIVKKQGLKDKTRESGKNNEKVISMSDGINTFIHLSLEAGISEEIIMNWTGRKTNARIKTLKSMRNEGEMESVKKMNSILQFN